MVATGGYWMLISVQTSTSVFMYWEFYSLKYVKA
jgi:hypothetical protein